MLEAVILVASLRKRISAALARRFPNNQVAPRHVGCLLSEYAESGIGSPHLINEIETGDEGKLWSRMWEAMLYRHIRSLGYEPKPSAKRDHGPDFRIEHQGTTIWIEAVVPSPGDIPAEYLELFPGVVNKPDIERVLRCTSAIKDKRDKLEGYREQGIVATGEATVIAINICRLSQLDMDGNGLSRLPLSMEAMFPIGPLAVPVTNDGRIGGPMQNTPRFSVRKPGGVEIRTTAFLDPAYVGVSAIVQAHQWDMHERVLALAAIHNPIALNPSLTGLLGASKEFVAELDGDSYQVRDICLEARLLALRESVERRFRAHEDRVVRSLAPTEAGEFIGEPNECHANVNRWCFMNEHFEHLHVHGWLVSGNCVLDKHTVVDIGDGELVDVTPMPNNARRTFLRHDGNKDEFRLMPNQITLMR